DDAVDRYAAQVDQLERRLTQYEKQLSETNARLIQLQAQYQNLENSVEAQRAAADSIARLSLREANEIIDNARKNADAIIHESLVTARLILTDLSRLYGDADTVKTATRARLEGLIRELDEFDLPKMPDMRWLEEAEKTMR
ncbi:MAG: DivIVA domain-containing protein, partial [Solobacterium sp.]|nr:DivIVA domain-containing protein [Solobacterium sp.]